MSTLDKKINYSTGLELHLIDEQRRFDYGPEIRDIPRPSGNSSNYRECPKKPNETVWIDCFLRCTQAKKCKYDCEYKPSPTPTWQ